MLAVFVEAPDLHDWPTLVARLAGHRLWFFSKSAESEYTDVGFERGDVLVFGSESQGLPDSLRAEPGSRWLRIPIRPQVRSLNLSNSVAVVLYEALRQFSARG